MTVQLFQTSGQRWTRNIRIGNPTVGYREFPIVNDAIKHKIAERRFSDRPSLTGVVYRQVHQVVEKETWNFETLSRQFGAFNDREWFQQIRTSGMGLVFDFWDHRANGNYTNHTVGGVTFPIAVMFVDISVDGLHNHDPFVDDVSISLRGV